jgi:acylphosphatase
MERRAYRISGRVQGVGFRYFTRGEARDLGLGGWVCNRADGSVEVRVEGEPRLLADFEARLRQGPPTGEVEQVKRIGIEEPGAANAPESYDKFEIRYGG